MCVAGGVEKPVKFLIDSGASTSLFCVSGYD